MLTIIYKVGFVKNFECFLEAFFVPFNSYTRAVKVLKSNRSTVCWYIKSAVFQVLDRQRVHNLGRNTHYWHYYRDEILYILIYKNTTSGLMGTWNDMEADDFTTKSGDVIDIGASNEDVYQTFGKTCRYL